MQTRFIRVEGFQVAYIELNEHCVNTIFFIHGNSCSKSNWRKQLADPLFEQFRLVAIDLPWHGESQLLTEAQCNFEGIGCFLAKVVDALHKNNPYLLCGVSLATNFIAEMIGCGSLPKAVMLAGPSIINNRFGVDVIVKPDIHVDVVFTDNPEEERVKLYAAETSLSKDTADLDFFINDFFNVQHPFRSMLGKSIAAKNYRDEILLLREAKIPLGIVYGEDEKVINTGYLNTADLSLWKNKIHLIPGASHLVNIDQPALFNELLTAFSHEVFI